MRVDVKRTTADPEITIFRDDGVTLSLRPVGRKYSPPHDVAHFIVEKALGLQKGFWGTVADGAIFPNMTVIEGRQPPHARTRSKELIKANGSYLNQAEVFVGVFQRALLANAKDYRKIIGSRVEENRRQLEPDEIDRLWSSFIAFRKHWDKLPIGQRVSLDWPVDRKAKRKRSSSSA